MLITKFFQQRMGSHVKRCIANYNGIDLPWGIVIVDDDTLPRQDYFCIVSADALASLAKQQVVPQKTYLFISKDAASDYEKLESFDDVSIFVTDLDVIPLYNLLQDVLNQMGSIAFNRASNGQDFGAFLYDVCESRFLQGEQIREAMRLFPTFADLPYRVFVFDFDQNEGADRKASPLWLDVERLFPRSNSALYFGRLVTVAQPDDSEIGDVELASEKLESVQALCEKYGCVCAISNSTEDWRVLRTIFQMCRSIVKIGRRMRDDADERVFPIEHYMQDLCIEYCLDAFMHFNDCTDFIYLVHPSAVRLIRHDRENETDLTETVRCYLRYGCNAAQAAELLNMHRNTVVYKLKRAEGIIGASLDDPETRERILWSLLLVEYCDQSAEIHLEGLTD